MMEHIISDERLAHINRAAYRAGLSADEVYTQMGADGPAVVRCRDCAYFKSDGCRCLRFLVPYPSMDDGTILKGGMLMANVDPSGFCAWGERKESE